MGAYLDHPQRDKTSVDDVGKGIRYGASSMQGWRISQEDAHNCCPDFDSDAKTALFGVYDGHGGAEVAQYVSMHFPKFLKDHALYKEGKIKECLEEAFLEFDALLAKEKTVEELVTLAGIEGDGNEADEKEEAAMLCQEAELPLEKVLERYSQGGKPENAEVQKLEKTSKKFQSPFIRAKKTECVTNAEDGNVAGDNLAVKLEDKLSNGHSATHNVDSCGDSKCEPPKTDDGDQNDNVSSSECESKPKPVESEDVGVVSSSICPDEKPDSPSQDNADVTSSSATNGKDQSSVTSSITSSSPSGVKTASSTADDCGNTATSNSVSTNEAGSSLGRRRRTRQGVIPAEGEDESSFDEDEEDTDEDDEDEDEPSWGSDDEDDSDDCEEGGEDDEEEDNAFFGAGDQPGTDSGCTAVVALIRDRTLYVANAGDSRCVLCRGGVAKDMSEDHKPEDDIEQDRITKAGGRVTLDGRVNGGLNLSRALGDHVYKQNEDLEAREQMISALPDIRSVELEESDEFLILACDGIWNVLNSQDAVDFVRSRIQGGNTKLSSIVEEMFEFCLAPDTAGDGSGCDNMTCIILAFDPFGASTDESSMKRKAEASEGNISDSEVKQDSKRTKIEDSTSIPTSDSS